MIYAAWTKTRSLRLLQE